MFCTSFFSPDLRRWACTIEHNRKQQVYVNSQFRPLYTAVYGVCLGSDGSRYAYLAQKGDGWCMVVDGKMEAEVSINSAIPCFSPDGKRLAYIAGRGPEWWVMVDGKPGPKFKGLRERHVSYPEEEEVTV